MKCCMVALAMAINPDAFVIQKLYSICLDCLDITKMLDVSKSILI